MRTLFSNFKRSTLVICGVLSLYSLSKSQTIYIRTVVHVLYTSQANNVSNTTVQNYITSINKAFAKQATPTFQRNTTIFDTIWTNTRIQLCLATTDPNNNPTNGITHTSISSPEIPGSNPSGPVWSAGNYFNIYLAPVYPEPGFPNFILGGWASKPTNIVPGAQCHYAAVATNATPPTIYETLAHEIGHVFGLDHLSDDNLSDTPLATENITPNTGYHTTCTSTLQNQNTSSLSQDGMHWGGVDPPDMVENFMNLSMCCAYMFTHQQGALMRQYISTHHGGWVIPSCSATTHLDHYTGSRISQINVFPNPANSKITVQLDPSFINKTIRITTIAGTEVKTIVIKGTETTIDVDQLSDGMYIIQIDKEQGSYKFVKY